MVRNVGAELVVRKGMPDVEAVVGRAIDDPTIVEDGTGADDASELAGGGAMMDPEEDEARYETPLELTSGGMAAVVEGNVNEIEIEIEAELAGGGMVTILEAEGTGTEMVTELTGGTTTVPEAGSVD